MKKKTIFVFAAAVASISLWTAHSNKNEKANNPLMLVSVEALSRDEGSGNTGPREEKKCMMGGHKMVCLTVNTEGCTDSSCY